VVELKTGNSLLDGSRRSGSIAAKHAMLDSMSKTARLRISRGSPARRDITMTSTFPTKEGMSVLDALRWIRTHLDSTLAIRYSCINANACKTCMALVNGEVEYTCIAKLSPNIIQSSRCRSGR